MRNFAAHLGLLAVVLCHAGELQADPPHVSYIFPAGGQRGTTVAFHVGGHNLHDVCPFEMDGPGVAASKELKRARTTVWFEGPVIPQPASQRKEDYAKAQSGSVQIAADAPTGTRRWRVWTSQGVTPSMQFVVGDLPEVVEQEIDGAPVPTAVSLPVTINGRIFPREDVDVWSFEAESGVSYTCDVMAARFGSPLDSRLFVTDPSGQTVAENVDAHGTDSHLRFQASRSGTYRVHIHDVNFSGLQDHVYRLTITDAPYVDHVFPLGGRRGTQVAFRLYGQRVPRTPVTVNLPDSGDASVSHRFNLKDGTTNERWLELSDLPEFVESDSGQSDSGQPDEPVALPAVFNGRIASPGEEDVWTFRATAGESFEFDLRAARLGSLLDSMIEIHDAAGKSLAKADDLPGGQTDSRLTFKVPADGVYSVRVRERFDSRGDERFAYRLVVDRADGPSAGFQLKLSADAMTVDRGSDVKLKLDVVRSPGFSHPIEVTADGLPAGVTLHGTTIAKNKNNAQLTIKAADDSPIGLHRLRLVGGAKVDDETVVTASAIVPAANAGERDRDELLLAVAVPTPFQVTGLFETKFAARGQTYVRHYSIERNGFEGPITVSMADRQVRHLQGVTGPTIVVPPGESEFDYRIKLPPWMEIGRTSRTCVMAVGDVVDQDGTRHKVSYTSHQQNDQIILLVDPGQLGITTTPRAVEFRPGKAVTLDVQVGRGRGMDGPVAVELKLPEHLRRFISADAITLPPDQAAAKMTVRFAAGTPVLNMPVTVQATANPGDLPYTAEATVEIFAVRNVPVPRVPVETRPSR